VIQMGICWLQPTEEGVSNATITCWVILVLFFMVKVIREGQPLHTDSLKHLCYYLFGFIWIGWTLSHCAPFYRGDSHTGGYMTILLCTSWIGDGAAYYVGSRFGRRKVMPNVSPKKSWEGVVAEIVFAVLLCLLIKWCQQSFQWADFFPPVSYAHYVAIGLMTSIGGIFGDALESVVKRCGRVKDSGIFFPGHGGVLDRFDTFFVNGPLMYFYWRLFIRHD